MPAKANDKDMDEELKKDPEKTPTTKLNFGQAVQAMKNGKMLQRAGWNGKGLFVFMQVPSEIKLEIVPKMQSLPDSVKNEFLRRFEVGEQVKESNVSATSLPIDPIFYNTIRYNNQFAIVYPNNDIFGWTPSPSDAAAEDWMILE
jgi:hypothetical protein